jgi:hypothetical protein
LKGARDRRASPAIIKVLDSFDVADPGVDECAGLSVA